MDMQIFNIYNVLISVLLIALCILIAYCKKQRDKAAVSTSKVGRLEGQLVEANERRYNVIDERDELRAKLNKSEKQLREAKKEHKKTSAELSKSTESLNRYEKRFYELSAEVEELTNIKKELQFQLDEAINRYAIILSSGQEGEKFQQLELKEKSEALLTITKLKDKIEKLKDKVCRLHSYYGGYPDTDTDDE